MNERRFKRFVGVCLIVGIFSIIFGVLENEKKEIQRKITYEVNISLDEKRKMQEKAAKEFMSYASIGKVDEAYELLDDESKKEFGNKEEFGKFITTKLFNDSISPKSYELSYVKQEEKETYSDIQYLIRFKILDSSKLDYSKDETLEFIEYNTYDIIVRDYSPNNYKIVLSKTRLYTNE